MEIIVEKFKSWKSIRNERASKTYTEIVVRFLAYVKKETKDLDIDDIVKYQSFLKCKADNTQAIAAYALRSFIAFTNNRGVTNIDPKEITTPRIEDKVPVYVVQEEFENLCDIAQFMSPSILLAVRMLWYTGVRVSELCDIKVAQIDLVEKCGTISTRKSFKPKQIFWDDETNDLLKGIISLNPNREYLFGTKGKISTRQVQRWIKDVCTKAGITKKITPHSFRHGATKEWLNNGVDLPAIKDLLGHKNLMSIEKYTKRLDDDIRVKGREAVRQRSSQIKFKVAKLFKT